MAGRYDFTIRRGETFRRTFTWSIDSTPVDVTDYIARMQVRPTRKSSALLIDLDSEVSDELTVGTDDGVIGLLLSDEVTQELDWDGLASYDLELESPNGDVKTLLEGRVALTGEVTREDAS